MKELLILETLTEAFTTRLNRALQTSTGGQAATVQQVMADFFLTTAIEEVDPTDREADAMLFEYGTYDWHDGRGERFTLRFTRQFQLTGDEEYFQLFCELAFAGDFSRELPACTSWSWDYSTLAAWQAAVQATPGFSKAAASVAKAVEVGLHQT